MYELFLIVLLYYGHDRQQSDILGTVIVPCTVYNYSESAI